MDVIFTSTAVDGIGAIISNEHITERSAHEILDANQCIRAFTRVLWTCDGQGHSYSSLTLEIDRTVDSLASVQGIVPSVATKHVMACPASKDVVAVAAAKRVVPIAAINGVITFEAVNRVGFVGAIERVVAARSVDGRHISPLCRGGLRPPLVDSQAGPSEQQASSRTLARSPMGVNSLLARGSWPSAAEDRSGRSP